MNCGIETATKHAGVAGHWGPEIRSDVHVRIESRERGGIVIELESRVKPYYGETGERCAGLIKEVVKNSDYAAFALPKRITTLV